jgi:hypothetical protein
MIQLFKNRIKNYKKKQFRARTRYFAKKGNKCWSFDEVFTNTLIQLKYLDQIQYQLTIFKNPTDLIKILITPRNLLDNKNLISSNRKYLILGKKD